MLARPRRTPPGSSTSFSTNEEPLPDFLGELTESGSDLHGSSCSDEWSGSSLPRSWGDEDSPVQPTAGVDSTTVHQLSSNDWYRDMQTHRDSDHGGWSVDTDTPASAADVAIADIADVDDGRFVDSDTPVMTPRLERATVDVASVDLAVLAAANAWKAASTPPDKAAVDELLDCRLTESQSWA